MLDFLLQNLSADITVDFKFLSESEMTNKGKTIGKHGFLSLCKLYLFKQGFQHMYVSSY